MEFTATQIAGLLNGEVIGNPDTVVSILAKIEEGEAGALSFLSNPAYEPYIYTTGSSICIVNQTFEPSKALPSTLTLVKVTDAYACFAQLLALYDSMNKKEAIIEQPSFIHESAQIGENVYIGAFAYIGANVKIANNCQIHPNVVIQEEVSIGENTTIYPSVSVYKDCRIGSNCIIHAGTVIGSDGFGFAPDENGVYSKIPQIGNVVIEDDVEIGSNCSIDRATLGSTFIRKGVKIDNLCQIAHNVDVDQHTAMAAQVGIAGSAKIGKHVMIGGQTGIAGHISIADHTKIVAQSGIPSTVKKAETLMGTPAIPINDYKRSHFGFRKLPELLRKIYDLENKLGELLKKKEA
ncbi:MAG: UDP-3-O-(3-hydroxymyristoyl)glucosamine N-acyltransferase [Cryomorphaceae bacterium]|jgi:UDP-3-O-[3-hydroxymyristoyl] glucosamine N-acyltransferase|nr:UDP-3-O-(3-hydroxymyristoyl)glucosamine N-acyltransferase [Cryomorphaceae bacterium]